MSPPDPPAVPWWAHMFCCAWSLPSPRLYTSSKLSKKLCMECTFFEFLNAGKCLYSGPHLTDTWLCGLEYRHLPACKRSLSFGVFRSSCCPLSGCCRIRGLRKAVPCPPEFSHLLGPAREGRSGTCSAVPAPCGGVINSMLQIFTSSFKVSQLFLQISFSRHFHFCLCGFLLLIVALLSLHGSRNPLLYRRGHRLNSWVAPCLLSLLAAGRAPAPSPLLPVH